LDEREEPTKGKTSISGEGGGVSSPTTKTFSKKEASKIESSRKGRSIYWGKKGFNCPPTKGNSVSSGGKKAQMKRYSGGGGGGKMASPQCGKGKGARYTGKEEFSEKKRKPTRPCGEKKRRLRPALK